MSSKRRGWALAQGRAPGLTNITLRFEAKASLKEIGVFACAEHGFLRVSIPEFIEVLEEGSFANCSSLSVIEIGNPSSLRKFKFQNWSWKLALAMDSQK
jgi:hypothetical protein